MKSIETLQISQDKNELSKRISRLSDEIFVLATILRTFNGMATKLQKSNPERVRKPFLSLLLRVWPYITHTSNICGQNGELVSSLSEFLLTMISFGYEDKDTRWLKEASNAAILMMDAVYQQQSTTYNIIPITDVIEEMIQIYGFRGEACAKNSTPLTTDGYAKEIFSIIELLVVKVYEIIRAQSEKSSFDEIGRAHV